MAEVYRKLEVSQLKGVDVFQAVIDALQKTGAEITEQKIESESPFSAKVSAFCSSIWGWGGMKIKVDLRKENDISIIDITGYIAQLATGPLKKNIKAFLKEFSSILENKHGYQLQDNITKQDFKVGKVRFTKKDAILALIVFSGVGLILIASLLFEIPEMTISLVVVLPAYFFVKKWLRKND